MIIIPFLLFGTVKRFCIKDKSEQRGVTPPKKILPFLCNFRTINTFEVYNYNCKIKTTSFKEYKNENVGKIQKNVWNMVPLRYGNYCYGRAAEKNSGRKQGAVENYHKREVKKWTMKNEWWMITVSPCGDIFKKLQSRCLGFSLQIIHLNYFWTNWKPLLSSGFYNYSILIYIQCMGFYLLNLFYQ